MLLEKIELEKDEIILKLIRKHWFIIGIELFGIVLMMILPFLLILITSFFPELLAFTIMTNPPLVFYSLSLWLLLSLILGFTVWTHYYLDLWVITDRRVITIDQVHFFNRKVSSFRLERLQDIKVSINGIIPTFLNFGTLRAQTASALESNFMSTGLPDPREIQATIQRATDARLVVLQGRLVP
ncbi:MAG TPA: PH domain-containing protein [Candidatus Paceibacterota bacterium]|nr:PH domain-containing protein [Candidatus Paceibacterota bacterium]HMO83186.1 PH domain-containing protein [Candidatus Paceibacterota bacterium]